MRDEYAPNAGSSEEKMGRDSRLKAMAEDHGTGLNFGKIGLHAQDGLRKDWGAIPAYAIDQESDGSMDYLSVKDRQAKMDSAKTRKNLVKNDGKGSY